MAERVVKIIVDALHVPDADVIPAADLRHDLGADSIDIVELVMALEKAFDLSIPDTACEEMLTVGSIISYVEHHSAH
ncbi:MAG: acyl carrier protein [Myxococcota bacterium]